ncbi:MAG: SpoIVB peptidase [Clostridia bacterium]|nr:SpoIVB peptidase [Clostridia bacterium]
MKKLFKMLLLVFFLFVLYIYTLVIENIPNEFVIFEGESISMRTLLGVKVKNEALKSIETASNNGEKVSEKVGKSTLEVNLFDKIPLKNVEVSVLPKTTVIPVGNIAGVKLYTNGVLVVGMSEIEGDDNKKYKPYENTGIKEGDRIIKINDTQIDSTDELVETVNLSQGEQIKIEYIHETKTKECSITPVKTNHSEYKLGLWVRDSAAGVGTVTFYEPSSKTFGALGHGITDIDTNELIHIASGEFITTRILNITKGESGTPGKIQGTIENQKEIGTIQKNSKFGIYGTVDNLASLNLDTSKEMEVALREEIQIGKATILCSLDNQKPQEYEIEIQRVFKENNYDNKSMQIKVTDERLLEKTGGIIQGMSGSPIIQNGKFIGAVTHVLVNKPHEGYAVFGDMMLKQARETN